MLFVTATDTGVGKTFFSQKIITEACRYFERHEIAYYKPIQCGKDAKELYENTFLETDYQTIERTCPEIDTYYDYYFDYPASPDYSAKLANVKIDLDKIKQTWTKLKNNYKFVVIEGAGGVTVPIGDYDSMLDLMLLFEVPVVLINRSSLGTINHSILSLRELKKVGVSIAGYISNEVNEDEMLELAKSNPEVKDRYDEQLQESFNSITRFTKVKQIEVYDLFSHLEPLASNKSELDVTYN
jgi:dethiobiotin synthetase